MRVKVLFFSVLAFQLSCEERYFLSLDPDVSDQLVINGFIDQSEGPYFVYVALTQGDWKPPLGIENAQVVIKDEGGQEESCVHVYEGKYSCAGDVVSGNPGVAYHLEVTYDGQLFTSRPDRMPLVEASSLMSWTEDQIITTSVNGVDVDVLVPNSEGFNFFQWRFEETYQVRETDFPDPFGTIPPPCYITKKTGSKQFELLFFNEFSSRQVTLDDAIVRPFDQSFLSKHIFIMYQQTISETYFKYLSQVEILTESAGTLFDPPSGRVQGNINTIDATVQPIGFFGAIRVDTSYNVIYPNQINYTQKDGCLYNPSLADYEYEPYCADCIKLSGSSKEPPAYWSKVN
jgi:hypothetical protein